MPDRISLIEQYDNRDVIAQIYRIINIAEHGAIETLTATKEGSSVKLIFTMHDGTKHEITFESNGVKDVYAVQHGSTEIVYVKLDDDTVRMFSFDIAIAGVTTDTEQTITARKNFTAPQTFSGGIEGTTMIDGDVQISNGHSLSVGDMSAGGMSIGMSGDGTTVLNNNNGVRIGQSLKVPTTATGIRSDDAVNGTRLQNDLDNYDFMVRTVGDQKTRGTKQGEWRGYQLEPLNVDPSLSAKWVRFAHRPCNYVLDIMEFYGTRGNNGYFYSKAIVSGVGQFSRFKTIDNVVLNAKSKVAVTINKQSNALEVWVYIAPEDGAGTMNDMDIYTLGDHTWTYLREIHDTPPVPGDVYTNLLYVVGSE